MPSDTQSAPTSKMMFWGSWIASGLPVLMLLFSAATKFIQPEFAMKGFEKLGWNPELALPLGIVELACTIIYLVPRTAILGAILLTGYLGGATATHVRAGDPAVQFLTPVVFGALLWLGLYLRCARLRALVPLRS